MNVAERFEELKIQKNFTYNMGEKCVRNIHWSFDNGQTFFGRGDISDKDLKRIFEWLTNLYLDTGVLVVFTGWWVNELDEKRSDNPIIRISAAAGIHRPYSDRIHIHRMVVGKL